MLLGFVPLLLALAPQHHDGSPGSGPAPALSGFDPVELVKGNEVFGRPGRAHDRNGFRYLFASDENAATFEAAPARYEIQLGGGCGSMGPLSGAGDPDRFFVHEGRIYVFASDQCRHSFQMQPERFVERPEVAPTTADMPAARQRGQALLERAVEGVGGAAALDALTELTRELRAERESSKTTYAWSEAVQYDFTTGSITHSERWDDWEQRYELRGQALRSTVVGKEPETLDWAARHEFDLQTSRDVVFLLRLRTNPAVLDAWSAGNETIDGRELERLVLRWNQRNTTAFLEPDTGRVRRLAWTGRLGSGAIGRVTVDFDDFEPAGALVLPQSQQVRFDEKPVPHRSGVLARLVLEPGRAGATR